MIFSLARSGVHALVQPSPAWAQDFRPPFEAVRRSHQPENDGRCIMADVLISYKRDQRERVKKIADHLRIDEELSVWFDANLETGRGEGFDAEIEREVTSGYSVIACWTPAAIRSVYVRAESKKGLERGVLVPVLLEPCALPVPFQRY
jgi:hypothetical protein